MSQHVKNTAKAQPKAPVKNTAKAQPKAPVGRPKAKVTKTKVKVAQRKSRNHSGDDLTNYIGAADHPDWATHMVSILRPWLQSLPQLCGHCLRLHVWADCVGHCSEMCAAPEIEQTLCKLLGVDAKFILHGACDECPHSKKFVVQNFDPKHWSDDICDRDWVTGVYTDTKTDPAVARQLPPEGIDIYCAGWPCGPFSHRGARKRGDDAKGHIIWAVINSIKLMNPGTFILENVSAVTEQDENNFWQQVADTLADELPHHNTVMLPGYSPLHVGYPNYRDRLKVLGARDDVSTRDKMQRILQTIVMNPLHSVHNWRTFLGLGQSADWAKFNCEPTADDLQRLQGCECGLDPWHPCPKHPCCCPCCKPRKGKRWSAKRKCAWRKTGETFMKKIGLNLEDHKLLRLSYVQTADVQGITTPQSARVRHLLNVCALCPQVAPLQDTLALVDITQSLARKPWRTDGGSPVIATSTVLWSMQDAKALYLGQMAELMGHRLINESFMGIRCTAQRKLLGNSIHIASMGSVLTAVLAIACPE